MEILNSETLVLFDYYFLCFFLGGLFGLLCFLTIFAYKNLGKLFSLLIAIIAIIVLLGDIDLIVNNKEWKVEEVKVIVHDWNVVYEEGWKVINQDGKIVTLQRKILD